MSKIWFCSAVDTTAKASWLSYLYARSLIVIAALQSMSIIEAPPAQIPLEDRDPETLTPAEMIQLVKIQKQRLREQNTAVEESEVMRCKWCSEIADRIRIQLEWWSENSIDTELFKKLEQHTLNTLLQLHPVSMVMMMIWHWWREHERNHVSPSIWVIK